MLSSAVPVAGGLASIAAAALKVGDRHIQTRRVVKVSLLLGAQTLKTVVPRDVYPPWSTQQSVASQSGSPTYHLLVVDRSPKWQLMRTSVVRWRGLWPFDSPIVWQQTLSQRPARWTRLFSPPWRALTVEVRPVFKGALGCAPGVSLVDSAVAFTMTFCAWIQTPPRIEGHVRHECWAPHVLRGDTPCVRTRLVREATISIVSCAAVENV